MFKQSSASSNMTTSDNINEIITWILTKISYQALKILLKLETQFPIVESKSSAAKRFEFFIDIINISCKTAYSQSTICTIHNVIAINEEIKKEIYNDIDLNNLITDYKLLNQHNQFLKDQNFINIMPFVEKCENSTCQQQHLNIKFWKVAHVIFLNSIKPCSIFNGTCSRCK